MNIRIRNNKFARLISLAVTLIATTFFIFGCGDAKTTADTPEETEKATEIASQEETEKTEPETEAVAEEETEATEQETETEEPVLFRIRISYGDGVNIGDLPSTKEAHEILWVDSGTEFDVYEVLENDDENKTFYRIKSEDGRKMYIQDELTQIIE